MPSPRTLFTEHPASVGETYVEHLCVAFGFGFRMLAAGAASVVHGIFPFLFTKTGSTAIRELHARLSEPRGAKEPSSVR